MKYFAQRDVDVLVAVGMQVTGGITEILPVDLLGTAALLGERLPLGETVTFPTGTEERLHIIDKEG